MEQSKQILSEFIQGVNTPCLIALCKAISKLRLDLTFGSSMALIGQ